MLLCKSFVCLFIFHRLDRSRLISVPWLMSTVREYIKGIVVPEGGVAALYLIFCCCIAIAELFMLIFAIACHSRFVFYLHSTCGMKSFFKKVKNNVTDVASSPQMGSYNWELYTDLAFWLLNFLRLKNIIIVLIEKYNNYTNTFLES